MVWSVPFRPDGQKKRKRVLVLEIESCDQPDVSELYSRPRLVPRCQFFNLVPGESFDVKDDLEMDGLGSCEWKSFGLETYLTLQSKSFHAEPPLHFVFSTYGALGSEIHW